MKISVRSLVLFSLVLVVLGVGLVVRENDSSARASSTDKSSWQQDMDAFCAAKLADRLAGLSGDERKGETDSAFFSWKLHTCIQVETTLDLKDEGAMNYVVSDLTYGFIAPPKWHHSESPLHVYQSEIRNYHHLYAEGYWASVSTDPGQQSVAEANAVKLDCVYSEANRPDSDSNSCTETDGYTQFGSIHTDTQTYHVVSWSGDEVIATDAERGPLGSTTTTLIIHPAANEIEVVDRTRMDDKQPELTKGMAGKSFGDHHELHGGMYLLDTQGVLFQCDQDGAVTDMRLDIAEKHHGDVVDVPRADWNGGGKATHKFTAQECSAALQKKLAEIK